MHTSLPCSKKLFSEGHKLVHLNLAIALFVGYLIFGVGVELATSNEVNLSANRRNNYNKVCMFTFIICRELVRQWQL